MITMLMLGTGIGAGLWALSVGLRPPPPRLELVLAQLDPVPASPPFPTTDPPRWAARAGRPLARALTALGLPHPVTRTNLRVLQRPVEVFLAEKGLLILVGMLVPAVLGLLAGLAGIALPWAAPVWASLLTAAAALVLPDLAVHAHAERRRAEIRHALSAYLNLVVVALAGGAGIDSALTAAAQAGDGWAFTQFRRALDTVQLTRTSVWAALGRLGDELNITDLTELAATVSLAGTEGAKIRTSLTAKATALHTHQLNAAEAAAGAATERMALPVVLLFAAFLIFIGYPALSVVLTDL